MSIRLRIVAGKYLALCAARSVEKPGDIYLDDAWHEALSNKFSRDWDGRTIFHIQLYSDEYPKDLVEQEESNNPNRTWWDETYGDSQNYLEQP